jgi:hypothetical protein
MISARLLKFEEPAVLRDYVPAALMKKTLRRTKGGTPPLKTLLPTSPPSALKPNCGLVPHPEKYQK